jgi:Rrf2 family protein
MRTNGRFAMALHVLAVLAYKDGDPVSSDFLSESVNTNPVIIRRLLQRLQRARLVDTRKGPGAGSRLSRSAARINLAEVYSAVDETELFAMPRRKPNVKCPVGQKIRAVLKPVFCSAEGALQRDLAAITLAVLMASIRKPSTSAQTNPVSR